MLNYEYPPLGGGAGNATYYLLKELAKEKNINITLVTSSIGKYQEKNISDNVKIYFLNIGKKGNLHYQSNKDILNYTLRAYLFCKKLNKKNNFDLVHAFFGIPCGYIAMKLDLPYIVSLRGSDVPFYNKRFYWLDKIIFQRLSKNIWERSKRVVTNSEGLKILAERSCAEQNFEVIYNGIDFEKFKPQKRENNKFTIISTSRLIKRKGINYLIDAFIKFNKKYKESDLIIIGDGNLREKIEEKVIKSGLKDKINILGTIDHNNINDYYKKSDVFVLPSLNEGMSNSLLEAMSSGLAIISTDTGGTRELIDKRNGIIINKKNINDIYKSLENLYTDRQRLKKMKWESRNKAEKMSWDNMANKYFLIYRDIIKKDELA